MSDKIFYALAIFVFGTGLFLFQPSNVPEVSMLQSQVKLQLNQAWQPIIGDQPYFDDLTFIYDSINAFYDQATSAMITLLEPQSSDQDIAFMFGQTYHLIANSASIADKNDKFMIEPPIYNIAPVVAGSVSGIVTESPANKNNSWITIQDNFTGQLYCVAIYNSEINKYLGACQRDGYH